MATSGVTLADEAITQYEEFQKHSNPAVFIILKIVDEKKIEVEHLGAEGSTLEDFKNLLPANECRYSVFKLSFETDDGRSVTKYLNISWAPDTARVKAKMLHSSSKQPFDNLAKNTFKYSATTLSDLDITTLEAAAKKI